MADATDESLEAFRRQALDLERALEIPEGFLVSLFEEDDWSFVVKIHSLVEAAVTQRLTAAIGDARLSPVFERLYLSNEQTGKVAFAKALGVPQPDEVRYIRALSELRNRLVHYVSQVRFSFSEYFAALDRGRSRRLSRPSLPIPSTVPHRHTRGACVPTS